MATEDGLSREEELRLLNEDNEEDSSRSGKKESKNVLGCLKTNLKLLLGAGTILSLIVLGIVFGAISNARSRTNLGRTARAEFQYDKIKLPDFVVPLTYRIYLHPNLTTFNVFGSVRILIACKKPTNKVLFHFKDNEIKDIKLMKGSYLDKKVDANEEKDVLVSNEYFVNTEKALVMVQSATWLKEGSNYTLVVRYDGKLKDALQGFYKSSYKNKAGETRYLATTHFEPAGARTAFPCFDEPALKATFRIIMVRSKEYQSTSNMPLNVTKTQDKHGVRLYVDHFQESVKMSTYLVAFVVHDFAKRETKSKRGVKLTVFAPKEQIDQTEFAVETAPKILDYYEEFFKVLFPLPKLDLIAIPDFSAGAMENWGLITYRMVSLLYNKEVSSDKDKEWVATVIAHEFAHQWFGNLVTMKWWNDLWLNEGFASFTEVIGVDHVHKEWKMFDKFVTGKVQGSLALDAHSDSHPISVAVHDPKEVQSIFDSISYDKGAAIIRMLKNYIGKTAYHNGLKGYLQKFQFSNAESDDLWSSFSDASGKDVKSMMDTWIKQMGFPLVTFKKDPKKKGTCVITQRHFLLTPGSKPSKSSPFHYKWDIPLTYKTKTNTTTQTLFNEHTKESLSMACPAANEWIKFNSMSIGFYRTSYGDSNWKLISAQLLEDYKVFSSADRSNLIDDAFHLARAELLDYKLAFELTHYLKSDPDYIPWNAFIGSMSFIDLMLQDRPGYDQYEKYIVSLVKPQVEKLGWKDTGTHLQKYLRSLILSTAVKHNVTKAVDEALKLFNDYKNKGKRIAANLKSVVYFAGIRYGPKENWDFLWKQRDKTLVAVEKRKIESALTRSKDPEILKKFLSWSIDSSKIRSGETIRIITNVASNKYGRKLAWDFTLKHWDLLYKSLELIIHNIPMIIKEKCTPQWNLDLLNWASQYGRQGLHFRKFDAQSSFYFEISDKPMIKRMMAGIQSCRLGYLKYSVRFLARQKQHLKEVRYGDDSFELPDLISVIVGESKTKQSKDKAKEFFKTHPTGPGKRAFNQALESIQNHIEWLKKFEKQIVAWLTNYNKMNP